MAFVNCSFQRTAGALLPIFSLPGPYGIGVLGKEALKFADLLHASGLHCWQVLPMIQAGAGNSPYSGVSAFAGDPLYIDPEALYEAGLLTEEELKDAQYKNLPFSVDYDWLLKHKMPLLKKAYKKICTFIKHEVNKFTVENEFWLIDYALYMTLKEKGMNSKSKASLSGEEIITLMEDELFSFYCFVQYEFYLQWSKLKKYCNDLGIGLIGDLPFYVSGDSSDVWANPDLFLLDKNFEPIGVAGTPPDYFSQDGQVWGNPIYNWEVLKSTDYQWWIQRIAFHVKYNDALRIDHFRGFDRFWYISEKDRDAKKGYWKNGPGIDLFKQYEKSFGKAPIIAEDLGTLDDSFFSFLKQSGFPGMRVIQFAFDSYSDNMHLPHNYQNNVIAYTGTHDNNTLLGWIWETSGENRQQAIQYCNVPKHQWSEGGTNAPTCRAVLRTLYQSVASITIAPVQDFCGFGEDTRINIPGEPEGNWKFRFTQENLEQMDKDYLLQISKTYKRNNSFQFIQ